MYKINMKRMTKLAKLIETGAHYLDIFEEAYRSAEEYTTMEDVKRFMNNDNYEIGTATFNVLFDHAVTLSKSDDFIAIDDVDLFELSDEELFVKPTPYKAHVSDQKGIKYCLKDENRLCHEECYADDEFCEMVVFLGYPEDKVKYPNAYPIYL